MASAAELVVILAAKDMASSTLKGFGQQLGGMGALGKIATAGLAAVAAAGLGLATGLASSAGAAMDFESAMSQVAAVAGGMPGDLERLSDLALQLGQDQTLAGIGATDAARAMRELAAAGLTVDQIIGGAALGALRLASAGGIDVGRAAEIAAMALANFGLEGNQAASVADLFARAANSSAISVDDIAESLKYVGPIANSMGLSIEEVTATIAALGNQGIKGSQAGTALRSMLVNLASPTKQAAKIIKELGLEFFDTNGQMKSLADVSEELKTGMAGLTDQQRAHALSTLFGNEALTAATVLYGEGAAGINKWLTEIQNGATAAQVGAIRNDNLKGSIEALKSSFETAQIVLGTAFLPALKQLVDLAGAAVVASIPLIKAWGPRFATALAAGLGAVPGLVDRAATAIGGLVTAVRNIAAGDINGAFGPILAAIEATFGPDAMARAAGGVNTFLTVLDQLRGVVNGAREAFAQLPTPVQQLAAGFLALGPTVRVLAVALPLLLGAFTGLGPIIGFLTSTLPVLGAVIAALGAPLTILIAAVAALGVAWATNWLGIRDQTMPIIAQVVGFVTGTLIPGLVQLGTYVATVLWPQMQIAWTQIQATITAAIAAILPALQQFAAWFSTQLLPAVQQAAAVVVPALTQMGAATIAAFDAALPGIQAFIAGMQQLGAAVLPVLVSVAATIQGTLGPAVLAIVTWASEVIPQFAAAWANVASIVGPLIGALATQIGAALATIAAFVEEHGTRIQAILQGAWQAMSSMIGAVLTVITGLISTALLVIAGDWEGAWQRLQTTATTAWGQMQSAIDGVIKAIVNIIAIGLLEAQQAATAAFEGIRAAIATKIEEAKVAVQNGVGQIPGILMGIAGAAGAAAASIGVAIIDGIAGALAGGAGRLASIASNVVNSALDAAKGALGIKSPSKEFAEIGHEIVAGLVKGMDDKQQDAAKKAADVASAVAKAVTDTLGAMKALANFDFATDSPTGEAMGWFRHLTESLLATMAEAASAFEDKALEHVGKFADAVGKVGGAVKSAVEGLLLLGKTNWADASPDGNAMGWFMHLVSSLVQNFVDAGANFEEDGLKGAERFADAVGKVTGVIAGAVTGLQALAKFVAPAEDKVSIFMKSLADLMEKFGTWAGRFEEDGLEASARFAEAAGKVVGILDNGVKGLMALEQFVAPAEAQVTAFMISLSDTMEKFGTWAGEFEADVLESIGRFAEAAGKVAGVIGPAVEGFAKLATFAAPSETAISQLAAGIRAIVRKFADMATMLDADGTKATGDFAEAAGKALGAAKAGVELFAAMAGDKDKAGNNVPVGIPSATAIDQLAEGIKYVIRKFAEMARGMEDEGIKEMQAFASAAGQVLASAKAGTDLFKSMEKLAVPSEEAINYLLGTIGSIITKIRTIATGIGEAGLREAQAFSEGSFNVISTLAGGLKLFEELSQFKDIPAAKLEELWKALEGALDFATKLFQRAEAIKTEAAAFADSMKEAARLFSEGMSIGNGLGSMPALSAPLGVGGTGGGGTGTPGGLGGAPTYNLIMNGNAYGFGDFEDAVVSTMQSASRKGRT